MDDLLKPIQTRHLTTSPSITLSLGDLRSNEEPVPLLSISSSKQLSTSSSSNPEATSRTDNINQTTFSSDTVNEPTEAISITSAQDSLNHLRSSPSLGQLEKILDYLTTDLAQDGNKPTTLELHTPTPTSSQIVKVLVDETIPQFWPILDKNGKGKLVRCLRSVIGLGGIVAKVRILVSAASTNGELRGGIVGITRNVGGYVELMEVLAQILGKTTVLWKLWNGVFMNGQRADGKGNMRGEILWKELVGLVAGGKVLGVASAAWETLRGVDEEKTIEGHENNDEEKKTHTAKQEWMWIGDGKIYSQWLGRGVGVMAENLDRMAIDGGKQDICGTGWKSLRMLFWRSFGLGLYCWDEIVETTTINFLGSARPRWDTLSDLLLPSSAYDKSRYLLSLLRILSQHYLDPVSTDSSARWWETDAETISRVAGVIDGVSRLDSAFWDALLEWVHGTGGVGDGIGLRRAVVAVLGKQGKGIVSAQGGSQELKRVLERSLRNFGDPLWIKHTPVQVQEVNVQFILLCAGYLSRGSPHTLKSIVQSSIYLNGISNRLATLSSRARFLGMVVGEALSGLADEKESKLDFHIEEMETSEAEWWKGLVVIEDKVGEVHGLKRTSSGPYFGGSRIKEEAKRRVISVGEIKDGMDEDEYVVEVLKGDNENTQNNSGSIEEDEESDDEFTPYQKPDSDPEDDDDDDPTMVNRNKTSPPVYIRDLLRLLRSHDNYDHQTLALTHAASLIRRKAGFGTELTEHLQEMAISLAGLQDKFEIPRFQEMKTNGLIALVVGKPVEMGRWIARAFFDGEFSIGGRGVLLTALGMGARELAGFRDIDGDSETKGLLQLGSPGVTTGPDGKIFPSKMLPGKLHELYSQFPSPSQQQQHNRFQSAASKKQIGNTSSIEKIVSSLETAMIQPMAATAADKLSGPDVLKVRTFSSRMAVEAKRKKPEVNILSKIIGEAFFYPLTGRWWAKLREFGPNAPQFNPYLLSHLLKTLALVLHAAGPSCPQLPQLTREFWDLLLNLRGKSSSSKNAGGTRLEEADAPNVMEAILFCLLTLLELNMESGETGKRRLVEEYARELVETGEWVEGVFQNAQGGVTVGGIGVGGTGDEEERVRRLAAAVLLRIKEYGEGYERRLMGEMGRWE